MDETLKGLYDQYVGAGHTETAEQFLDAKNQMGDEAFYTFINSQIELKKKDDTQVTPENLHLGESVPPSRNIVPETVTEQIQGVPVQQNDQRFLETATQPILPQENSTESVSTSVAPFSESVSISPNRFLDSRGAERNPTFFDNLSQYKNYDPKTGVFSGKRRIIPQEEIDKATKFYDDQNARNTAIEKQNAINFLAGKPDQEQVVFEDFSVDEANQIENQQKAESLLPDPNDNKEYLNAKIPYAEKNVEYIIVNSTNPDTVRQNNERLLDYEKTGGIAFTTDLKTGDIARDQYGNYYHTYVTDEAVTAQNEYVDKLNSQAEQENKSRALYNFENLFSAKTPETENQEYLNELDKEYGITLLTPEQREQMSTAEGRRNIEIELETQKRLKENNNLDYNTVLTQVSKEKQGLSTEQKVSAGSDYVKRMFFGGAVTKDQKISPVFGEANGVYYDDDEKDEYNFYLNYFSNPENVAEFGEFMNDDGKALFDSSWIRRKNTVSEQKNRKQLFETFLSWKGKQDRLDFAFSRDAIQSNIQKAENFQKQNNLPEYQNQIAKISSYEEQMKNASSKIQQRVTEFDTVQQNYSKINKQNQEKQDFQMRVQNNEFSANAQNILGNVLLGAETSVQNAVTGILRIGATPFGKGNANDFVDLLSEPISIGNVDIARISDQVIYYSKGNENYKEINGTLYQVGENGKIFRPTKAVDKSELTETDRERDINSAGLAFVTSKMLADIYITQKVGGGINSRLSTASSALSNSKKITSVFGEGSQISNQAANFARVMSNPSSNMITGWTVQMYNDNYLAAKNGGIENETNRHLYAFTTSFMLAQIQRINPDTNFLKTINSEYKGIVSSLMENNTQKALIGIQSFTQKAFTNTSKELVEENIQQGTQDITNLIINATGNKDLQVSTVDDYKDVFIGTIVPSIVASGLGGRVRQAEVGGRKIDLTQFTRNELVTELARTKEGVSLLQDFRDNSFFESQQNEADKLLVELKERQKYIDRIPDSENYSTQTINQVIPILQEIDRKNAKVKSDDGVFKERIQQEVNTLSGEVNSLLDNDQKNENTAQSAPKSETVQSEGRTETTQSQQIETPTQQAGSESSVSESPESVEKKIKNKSLFKQGGLFANILGGSGIDSVLSGHQERNGVEFIQWSNPNTGEVDVIMTGTGSHDFVGYYRIYEDGKPTNRWSSKFENQSRNKDNFKLMISGVQDMLPGNHEYTENTSISTDGLRVWEQQLRNGYELQTDADGNIVTNEVMINGDSIENDLGIDVEKGAFNPVNVNTNEQFETAKKALLPKLKIFGLDENNIIWDQNNNTIKIDLPVLKRSASQNETAETKNNNPQSQPATVEAQQNIPAELEVLNTENNENQETIPNIAQPSTSEASVESGNTATATVENSKTAAGENTQTAEIPQININQEIFSDEVNPAELSEEQSAEAEAQINDAVALFESFNQPVEDTTQQESVQETTTTKSRVSSNGKYTVVETTASNGGKTFELLDINDNPVKLTNKQKDVYVAEYINAQEYPDTELDLVDGMNENEVSEEIISKSENPKEVAQVIATTPRFSSEDVVGSKEWAIAQVVGGNGVSRASFIENDDENNITNAIARTYFGKNKSGKSLDAIAQQASEQLTGDYSGESVTVQDIVDFIKKYPNDPTKAERPNNPVYDAAVEKFIKLTGQNPTKNLLDKILPKEQSAELNLAQAETEYDAISAEQQNQLNDEYNKWFNSLSLEQKTEELQKTFYENDSERSSQEENRSNDNQSTPNGEGEGNQNVGNEESAESSGSSVQRQQTSGRFSGITKSAFDALIEKLKKPFAKAFKNLNVTTDWNAFQEKAKALGINITQLQFQIDYKALEKENRFTLPKILTNNIFFNNVSQPSREARSEFDESYNNGLIEFKESAVDSKKIIPTQRAVNIQNLKDVKNAKDLPILLKVGDQYFVIDGHHRISDKILNENNNVNALVFESDIQFMHTANGEIYGAKLPDGTIYFNPEKMNANTAIHEFSHLWEQVMPNAWNKGLEFFKETSTGKKLFNQLKSEGNYSSLSDDLIWSEALNTHIGNIGEQQYQNPKGKMKEFVDWFKNTMAKFLNAVGIKNNFTRETNLSAFTNTVLGDLMGEIELMAEGNNTSTNVQFSINKKAMPKSTFAAVANATSQNGREAGYQELVNSNWFKGLDPKVQNSITAENFHNTMIDQARIIQNNDKELRKQSVQNAKDKGKEAVKKVKKEAREKIADIISDYKDKIKSIKADASKSAREKSLEQRRILRTAVKDIKSHLASNMFVGKITPTETNRLIRKASEIGTRKDISKAVDEFTKLYDDIRNKAESRIKQKEFSLDEYNEVKPIVEQLKNSGLSVDEVLENIKNQTLNNKRAGVLNELYENQIKAMYANAGNENLSPEQAYEQMKAKQREAAEAMTDRRTFSEKAKKAVRLAIKYISDRQYLPKKLLQEIGAGNTKSRMVAMAGASARARMVFDDLNTKIFAGLKAEDKSELNAMIVAKRILSIEKNRADRGLPPMQHPYANPEKALEGMKTKLGNEKFADLENRAGEYFKAFKDILTEMKNNGLISQDAYDNMIDIDYQPRLFIDRLLDADGNLDPDGNFQNFSGQNGGLKSEILKSLGDGSDSAIIDNAEWLLKTAMASRYKAMAMNEVNRRFMTDEYWKAKNRFDNIDPKNFKDKAEKKFYEYFRELQSKIKDNPIVGVTENGNPKYRFETAPQGFTKAYYYVDGVKNEFFLADDFHKEWHDVKEGYIFDPKAKGIINKWSGAGLIKAMATGYNPTFAFTNTPRDFMQTLVFSPEYSNNLLFGTFQLGMDQLKAVGRMFKSDFMGKEDSIFQKYLEYGGGMDFLYVQGLADKDRKLHNAFRQVLDSKVFEVATLMKLSKWSEMMTRMAIFERSIQNQLKDLGFKDISDVTNPELQDDIYYNAVNSARSIMDFNQGGKLVKDLDTVMPYLNAATQGTRVAIDAFRERPLETSVRMFQAGGLMASTAIGVSYALLAMAKGIGDDEEDKMSITEDIINAYEGLSQYQRANYINIVLPSKNDKGERHVFKIAKTQFVAPLSFMMEEAMLGVMRRTAGKPEKDFTKIMQETGWVANKNMTPIEMNSPAKFLTSAATKNPLMKASLTYITGYDFFKEEFVTFDVKKSNFPKELEGYKDQNVEDFYKSIGSLTGGSPARMKAFVESIVTTPETNPFVTMMYGSADLTNAVIKGDSKSEVATELKENIAKVFTKRLIGQASDFNRMQRERDKVNAEVEKAILQDEKMKLETDILAKKLADGKITDKDITIKFNEMGLKGEERQKANARIDKKIKGKASDNRIYDILYSTSNSTRAKAILIKTYFPEVYENSVEGQAIREELKYFKLFGDKIREELVLIQEEQ